jgi:hypothetical protein
MIQFDESKIPPLPAVAARVMQFDPGSPNSSIATLERIISPDQGISAELLRVSNSAYYGRSGSIKTLRDEYATTSEPAGSPTAASGIRNSPINDSRRPSVLSNTAGVGKHVILP